MEIKKLEKLSIIAISIFAMHSAAWAQKKPEAVAKPAEAQRPTAPPLAAQPVSPTVSSSRQQPGIIEFWKEAAITAQVYGGINYSTKSTYASAVDTAFGTAATYLSPAFGATVWYGNSLTQIGISGGYRVTYSNTLTVSSITYTQKSTQIPLMGYVRYFVIPNFSIGLGAGAAINTLKIDTGSATTYTATVPIFGVRAGYDFEIAKDIFIGGTLDVSYYIWTVNQKTISSGTASDYSNNALNISPIVTIGMKF